MFYHWAVLSRDSGDPPLEQGVLSDEGPEKIRAAAATVLRRDGRAIMAVVAECWPSGHTWYGMRDTRGGVTWLEQAWP